MPKPVSASRTSSSLNGLKIAITIFIAYFSTLAAREAAALQPAHAKGVPATKALHLLHFAGLLHAHFPGTGASAPALPFSLRWKTDPSIWRLSVPA
jgi:hypothetical protein